MGKSYNSYIGRYLICSCNISNTRDRVSSEDIQTPRRELKITRAVEYFWSIFCGGWQQNLWYLLRYHGRWIDSVWKSRSYADALKGNPINLAIHFLKA